MAVPLTMRSGSWFMDLTPHFFLKKTCRPKNQETRVIPRRKKRNKPRHTKIKPRHAKNKPRQKKKIQSPSWSVVTLFGPPATLNGQKGLPQGSVSSSFTSTALLLVRLAVCARLYYWYSYYGHYFFAGVAAATTGAWAC